MTTTQAVKIFRLTDMKVEEVSLVDRAANRHKFLIVKGASNMPSEVKPDGKGGHVTEPTKLKITATAKSELEGRVAELTARCALITKHLADSEVVAEAALPAELVNAVGELDAHIAKGLKQFSSARQARLLEAVKMLGDIVKEVTSDAPEVPPPAAPEPTVPSVTKSDFDAVRADIDKLASAVTAAVASLTEKVTTQTQRIESVEKSSRGTSNANTDASATTPPQNESFAWPMDMNRPDTGKPKA